MTRRRWWLSSRALVVMAALVAITMGAITAFAAKPPKVEKPPKEGGPPFTLSGGVDDLWPGGARPLDVTVDNPYRFEIVLTSLDVEVAAASAACPASVLHVTSLSGEVSIAGRGQITVRLTASLDADAPNECQGSAWGLTYTATARRT